MMHQSHGGRFRAVIPSLAGTVERLQVLTLALTEAGATPVVVPTGASVERALDASEVPFSHIGANPGFAATIAHGAGGDWDWLLVVNDDVTVDPGRLGAALRALNSHEPGARVLAFLDPVAPKLIPTRTDALLGLSLLGPVLRSVGVSLPRRSSDSTHTFGPFSFVAVSRRLWDELGGLDEAFVYTYEDADFARRARAAGATLVFLEDTGVTHRKYGTSTSRMRDVLPCAAVSTATYLETLGMGPRATRAACITALALRTPLVLVAGIPPREHLAGIAGAARAFVFRRRPTLPDYAAN